MELSLEKIRLIIKLEKEMNKGIFRKKCFTKNQVVNLLNGSRYTHDVIDECIKEGILKIHDDSSFILDNNKSNELFFNSRLWNEILDWVNVHENPAIQFEINEKVCDDNK